MMKEKGREKVSQVEKISAPNKRDGPACHHQRMVRSSSLLGQSGEVARHKYGSRGKTKYLGHEIQVKKFNIILCVKEIIPEICVYRSSMVTFLFEKCNIDNNDKDGFGVGKNILIATVYVRN